MCRKNHNHISYGFGDIKGRNLHYSNFVLSTSSSTSTSTSTSRPFFIADYSEKTVIDIDLIPFAVLRV